MDYNISSCSFPILTSANITVSVYEDISKLLPHETTKASSRDHEILVCAVLMQILHVLYKVQQQIYF